MATGVQDDERIERSDLAKQVTTVGGSAPRPDIMPAALPKRQDKAKLEAQARTMMNQFIDEIRTQPRVRLCCHVILSARSGLYM